MASTLFEIKDAIVKISVVSGLLRKYEGEDVSAEDARTVMGLLDMALAVLEADLSEREKAEREDKARNVSACVANRIEAVGETIDESRYPVTTDAGKVRDALLAAMLAKDMLRELAGNPAMPEAVEACAELIITSLTDC